MENGAAGYQAPSKGAAGYTWLYRETVPGGRLRVGVTIVVIALSAGYFAWYSRTSNDASPDSQVGMIYALLGTFLLLLAATLFSLRRRSQRRRKLGGLRASLGWHISCALMGLAFLFMHAFGEFNPRTGTYALYGMIALVISGIVGRLLDRVLPLLIAGEVHRVLTDQGDDRIETISCQLQVALTRRAVPQSAALPLPLSFPRRNLNTGMPATRDQALHMPWDLAYLSLASTPQEISGETGQLPLLPGTQARMDELAKVRRAMQRELCYRYALRSWRILHILLALVTIGLLIWHIVYALQLLLPTLVH